MIRKEKMWSPAVAYSTHLSGERDPRTIEDLLSSDLVELHIIIHQNLRFFQCKHALQHLYLHSIHVFLRS